MVEITLTIEIETLNSIQCLQEVTSVASGVLLQAAFEYGLAHLPEAVSALLSNALNDQKTFDAVHPMGKAS